MYINYNAISSTVAMVTNVTIATALSCVNTFESGLQFTLCSIVKVTVVIALLQDITPLSDYHELYCIQAAASETHQL